MIIYFPPIPTWRYENITIVFLEKNSPHFQQKSKDSFEVTPMVGSYHYRFLIDGKVEINDMYSNWYEADDDGKLWSVLSFNEYKQRIYNQSINEIRIARYSISSTKREAREGVIKRSFGLKHNRAIFLYLCCRKCTGYHTVSAIYFNPRGEVFDYTEEVIGMHEGQAHPIELYYELQLTHKELTYLFGRWRVLVLVDGQLAMEENFILQQMLSYNKYGAIVLGVFRRNEGSYEA